MRTKKPMLFLNIYILNQSFGGPEEGGWWYTTGEPVKIAATFFNLENARKAQSALQERIDAERNKPMGARANLYSVACEGRMNCQVEPHPPQFFPDRRPHYE